MLFVVAGILLERDLVQFENPAGGRGIEIPCGLQWLLRFDRIFWSDGGRRVVGIRNTLESFRRKLRLYEAEKEVVERFAVMAEKDVLVGLG